MDLRELKDLSASRHPWELSRARAVRFILKMTVDKGLKLLDIGCGDGYVTRELFKGRHAADITAVDTNLTEEHIAELSKLGDGIKYMNGYPEAGKTLYDLVLLLDVIEHVVDDKAFLRKITEERLDEGGRMLITAPAFQSLFGPNDRFLHHYRRYSLSEIKRLAGTAGLECSSSGYFFASLIIPRFLSLCLQRLLKKNSSVSKGVGNWNHGKMLTKTIELFLRADNMISFTMNKLGIKIPGLTVWILCEKPR